jgi:hypothetical protein
METQKVQLKKLLEYLGYNAERAEELVTSFFSPAEGVEAELPIDNILLQAQEYARPHLRSSLKREFSHEFKGQYMGEAINKIVAISKGKIRRANYEDGNVERALTDLIATQERGAESESRDVVNELKEQLAALALEKEQTVTQLRNEFAERENNRLVYDAVLGKLGALQHPVEGKVSKRLSVDQQHAAKTILRELGDEYLLRYDEEGKDIAIYNKANPTERVSDNGKPVNVNDLVERSLVRNNWIAQSNGGSVNPQQFLNRPVRTDGPVKQVTEKSDFRTKLEAQVGEK